MTDIDVEDIRSRVDLVKLIEDSGVELYGRGYTLSGICPFHEDKTPSLRVQPAKQWFWCYGCLAGGDIFSWVMKTEGCTFRESVQKLSSGNKINSFPIIRKISLEREKPSFIPDLVINSFHEELVRRPKAIDWLNKNRFWSYDVITRYKIGFDQASYRFTIPIQSPILRVWEDLRMYDPFGRHKQKMMPHHRGPTSLPYFLTEDRSYLLIVEGEPDALAAASLGLNVATNTCGSGSAYKTWREWYGLTFTDNIILCFDLDEAGQSAIYGRNGKNGLIHIFPKAKVAMLPQKLGEKGDLTDSISILGPEWTRNFILRELYV